MKELGERLDRKSDAVIDKVDVKADKTDSKIDNAVLIFIAGLFLQSGFNIWMKGGKDKANKPAPVQQ